jgi:predicted RNA-binding protein with PUA-like domain
VRSGRRDWNSLDVGGGMLEFVAMQYWLVKQEPEDYSWSDLEKDGRTAWTGVRNFQARNNLRKMKKGDLVLFYHSVTDKQVVGVAKVEKEAYADPTAEEGDWSVVDLVPKKLLSQPVGLDAIKSDSQLADIPLIRQSRLSVMSLSAAQFKRILKAGKTTV